MLKNRSQASDSIKRHVLSKMGGRLKEFSVDEEAEELVLHGTAPSYHVKQLVLAEVMALTDQPIRSNGIRVVREPRLSAVQQ